jgi:hypothetical protein
MDTHEPKHFLRICVERELTDDEFEDMTEIVDEEIGDIIATDECYEHYGPNDYICYMFTLSTDIANSEQGLMAGDIITYELSNVWPESLDWEIEASSEDIKLDVADDATPEQVEEAAVNYFRNILNG